MSSAFKFDPITLFDECVAARKKYRKSIPQLGPELVKSVTRWRWANDNMMPIHPLFHEVDTSESEGPWKVAKRKWIAKKPKQEFNSVKTGLNASGEIVAMFRPRGAEYLVVRGDDFFDVLAINSKPKHSDIQITPHHDSWFFRYCLDEEERIAASVRCDGDYLSVEEFRFENGRPVESVERSFERDNDDTVDEEFEFLLRDGTRQRRVETKWEYFYAESGALERVDVYRSNVEGIFNVAYTQKKKDTVASVTKEAVSTISEYIVDHFENAAFAKPLRRILLVYSAEHAECGLPNRVAYLCGRDGNLDIQPESLFDTSFSSCQWLEWPPAGRRGEFNSLTNRLYALVDDIDDLPGGEEAPLPFREMLWKTSGKIYKELSKSKLVSEDFLVYPIDDHEDVDADEDFRQSLPKSVVKRVLG